MFDYLSYENVMGVAGDLMNDLSTPVKLFLGLGLFKIVADFIISIAQRRRESSTPGTQGAGRYGNNPGDTKMEGGGWAELEAHARKYNDWDG